MILSSFTFLFFFLPAVLIAYYINKNYVWRNLILLLSSLIFYAWGGRSYVLLMIFSILINWWLALLISKSKQFKKVILVVGLFINLSGIAIFKYNDLFIKIANSLFNCSLSKSGLSLPIGISFFTFQAISYLIDTYRGTILPQGNPFLFGSYLALFPKLIAGPIVRYETIENEITKRNENINNFIKGLNRFILGLGKKMLIASTMALIANSVLSAPPTIGAIPAWVGFISFSLQIYFDFSGYSDMAIGLGEMFGFHFLENFNYPYIAKSVTDFWRRWHISLSSFFRDYVYIPLGGNKVSSMRLILNLLIVWSLTGLWHGASYNFIFWGGYYGILLIGEKFLWGKRLKSLHYIIQHLYTILVFIFGWVIFRLEDVDSLFDWIYTLIGGNGLGSFVTLNELNVLHYFPWIIIAILGATPFYKHLEAYLNKQHATAWIDEVYLIMLFCFSSIKIAIGGFNPFIYSRF